MKRLIVDGQLFQTPAWHRGMGKYSVELLRVLQTTNNGWQEISLLLSEGIATKDTRLDEIRQQLPGVDIIILPLQPAELDNIKPTESNRQVVEEYIESTVHKDDDVNYLVLSILQSGTAPAFPNLPNIHTMLLFYDLIPLMFFKTYLNNAVPRLEYASRFDEFFRADTYLVISKTVGNDLAWHTGISKKRIHTIDGGPIRRGSNFKKLSVKKPFILMPTGDDLRKNNRRAIEAFALFNASIKYKYQLVVTSYFTPAEQKQLQDLSEHVLFTGNIEGSQLNFLYRESAALLFPTEYEGLGLPILEAMEFQKPILCSDISVFREISTTAMECFDPFSVTSIVASLHNFESGKVLPDKKQYQAILKKYTWDHTAELVKNAIKNSTQHCSEKKSVVVFCPLPSHSMVGGAAQLLHAELSKWAYVRYRYESRLTKHTQRITYTSYTGSDNYLLGPQSEISLPEGSTALYHLENESTSARTLFTALAVPGIAVLYSKSFKKVWQFMQEMHLIHEDRYAVEQSLSQICEHSDDFLVSIVASQKAIIVFDKNLYTRLETIKKQLKSKVILKCSPVPSAETVYREVLPKNKRFKTIRLVDAPQSSSSDPELSNEAVLTLHNQRDGFQDPLQDEYVTDHELITMFLSSEEIECTTDSYICDILKAQAAELGVVVKGRKAGGKKAKEPANYKVLAQMIDKLIEEVENE